MHYPKDPNDCFGLLRSLLQDLSESGLGQLCGLLTHVQGLEPEIYQEQWLPYLHDVWTNGWATPLRRCLTLDELNHWVELAPFAHFLFEPRCESGQLKPWFKSPLMAHVSALSFERCRLWPGCFETLFEHNTFDPLHTLILGGQDIKSRDFDALWHQPICQHLNTLNLSHNEVDTRVIEQLLDAPFAHVLKHLHLRGCGHWIEDEDEDEVFVSMINEETIKRLASASHLQLKSLDVSDNTPYNTDELDLSSLLASPQMAQLESLNLEATTPSDETIHVLSTHPNMRALQHLDLSSTWLETHHIIELAQSPHLANVTVLSLEGCELNVQACSALARSTLVKGIQELVLDVCEIGPEGVTALFEGTSFERLRRFCLGHCEIGHQGALSMIATDLSAVETLMLWHCALGDEEIALLVQSETLAPKKLELNHNALTAVGLQALFQSPILKNIEHLSLWGIPFGEPGVETLLQWTPPKTLKSLELYDNNITKQNVDTLRQSTLWPKITSLQNEF